MTITLTTAEALRIVSEALSTKATGTIRVVIDDQKPPEPELPLDSEPLSPEEVAARFAALRETLASGGH